MEYELKILLCKGNCNAIKTQALQNGIDTDDVNQLAFNNVLLQSSGVPIITKFE
jgi:hypothetical protein